ncbi:GNAT family N-acetyltransferase [Lactiplantibacillus modestisalitolerans]|uniref:GNAT family N-acetyltransferase n=1 Tax=Lactiplantibacillus modestisalitolerans TaxID=1457219 RepID=A0ABV5WSC9_9LACO|nr:GNAT family N-acetyltransferase [Lactiplantibacillus modestisalitolerans]
MTIQIRPLRRQDFDAMRRFAIDGMHLDRYTHNAIELAAYSRYFVDGELLEATQAYGAYQAGHLVGALLAHFDGQTPVYRLPLRAIRNRLIDWAMTKFYGNLTDQYERANLAMRREVTASRTLAGELSFLVVDPQCNGQGIGTQLLTQLTRANAGQTVFLYTDSDSTYQFYLHRGFHIAAQRQITIKRGLERLPLTCYLMVAELGR